MSKILNITPIRGCLDGKQARLKIEEFLYKVLHDRRLLRDNIDSEEQEELGGREYTVLTMKDGSKWVTGDKGLERLIGFYYLSTELERLELENKWQVAETKYFLKNNEQLSIKVNISEPEDSPLQNIHTLHCTDIITCSKYAGRQKLTNNPWDYHKEGYKSDKSKITDIIGYNDFINNVNLREQEDGTIIIIDTEYSSFSSSKSSPVSTEAVQALGGSDFVFTLKEIAE